MDDIFDALSNGHRRRLLLALYEQHPHRDGGLSVPTYVERVDQSADTLRLELHHTHLPRLADRDFVDWNSETETVTPGPRFEELVSLLEHLDESVDPPRATNVDESVHG